MSVKLLFITSHYFCKLTEDALVRLNLPIDAKVIPYDNYIHIAQLYETHARHYDAVLTSGRVAMSAIAMAHPDLPTPLFYFQLSADALHRDILKVILDTRSTDLNRIAMDFLVTIGDSYSVADFLKIDDLEQFYCRNVDLAADVGLAPGRTVEDLVRERIIRLWQNGAIDLVICQYSSIVPSLQEQGIPVRCPFISDSGLKEVIQDALVKIELSRYRDNHPAIIQVFPRFTNEGGSQQIHRIHGLLQEYIRKNLIDCVLQENPSCCLIISAYRVLRFLTGDFRECLLSAFLEEQAEEPIVVAYGIGTNVSHAMNNVQIASKEAKLTGKPFLVDSNGNLIGPLSCDGRMVITPGILPEVSSIAKRCALSAMTIQKLQTMVQSSGSNKITVPDLAQKLGTTIRNANRIMLNLCRGNAARPVYSQATHSRGRPILVYELDFGT